MPGGETEPDDTGGGYDSGLEPDTDLPATDDAGAAPPDDTDASSGDEEKGGCVSAPAPAATTAWAAGLALLLARRKR